MQLEYQTKLPGKLRGVKTKRVGAATYLRTDSGCRTCRSMPKMNRNLLAWFILRNSTKTFARLYLLPYLQKFVHAYGCLVCTASCSCEFFSLITH